ncbi:hypothetical protein BD311DRAFT_765321, partial [Dichomitus squalens]
MRTVLIHLPLCLSVRLFDTVVRLPQSSDDSSTVPVWSVTTMGAAHSNFKQTALPVITQL